MTPTLADYLTYDEPRVPFQILLRNGEHAEAVTLAIEKVKELRAKGVQDTVRIRPHDDGSGPVYDVLQIQEAG